jgi:hypothetical protein
VSFLGVDTSIHTIDPKETFAQDHFVGFALSDLERHAQNLLRRQDPIGLAVHIDNCRCHRGGKVVEKMRRNHMIGLDRPRYSPDLSSCDFRVFSVLTDRMKRNALSDADQVSAFVCDFWSEMTLDDCSECSRCG